MTDPTPADITNRWLKIIGVLALFILGVTQTPLLGWLADVQASATISVGTYLNASPISQTLEDNLLAHWTFDSPEINWNDTNSEIKDRGVNNNHGNATSSMTAQTSTIRGPVGQALQFNGETDFVNLGSDSSIDNLFQSGDNAGTISFWLYIDDADEDIITDQTILRKIGTQGWMIYVDDTSNNLTFLVDTSSQFGIWSIDTPFNKWFHVSISYMRGNRPDMYINGALQTKTEENFGGGSIYDSGNSLIMGEGLGSTPEYFKGAIDDIRIYDNFFTAEQVQYLYDSTKPTIMATTPQSNNSLEDGLMGHWTFDGPDINWSSTTTEIRDKSGNQAHGDILNVEKTDVSIGKMGQAISLTNSSHSLALPREKVTATTSLTMSAWIYMNDTGDLIPIIGNVNGQTGSDGQFLFIDNAGAGHGIKFNRVMNGIESVFSPSISTDINEWVHVTYTFDGQFENMYHNGINIGTRDNGSGSYLAENTEGDVKIGSYNSSGGILRANSQFDDVRVYNRALSAEEVSRLYQQGVGSNISTTFTPTDLTKGLVGHWTFDGPDINWTDATSEIKDGSGQNNHANAINITSAKSTAGKIGQALSFDGVDDYVVKLNTANNVPEGNDGEELTISLWAKADTFNGSPGESIGLLTYDNGGGSSDAGDLWQLRLEDSNGGDPGGHVWFRTYGGNNGGGTNQVVSVGEWVHLVVIWDIGTAVKVYANGSLDSDSEVTDTSSGDGTQDLIIGSSNQDDNVPFDGVIDDVRIYNKALSLEEIQQLYDLGK